MKRILLLSVFLFILGMSSSMAQYESSYYQYRYSGYLPNYHYTPPKPRVDYAAIARAQRAAAQAAAVQAARARAAAARAAAARAAVIRAQQARARAEAARQAQIRAQQAAARARAQAEARRKAEAAQRALDARRRAEAARQAQLQRERIAAAKRKAEAAQRAADARRRAEAYRQAQLQRQRDEAERKERARLAAIEASKRTYYRDSDGDGYGNPRVSTRSTYKPSGYVSNRSDCNDRDRSLNPNTLWYSDNDGDGYGSALSRPVSNPSRNNNRDDVFRPAIAYYTADATHRGCTPPSGRYVRNNLDLDDNDRSVTTVRKTTYYRDADGDGYGSRSTISAFTKPSGYAKRSGDPDDNNRYITPASRRYYYPDNDGDGYGRSPAVYYSIQPPKHSTRSGDLDDNDRSVTTVRKTTYYRDADGDGYGDPRTSTRSFSRPSGYVTNNTDCDDRPGMGASLNPNTWWYYDGDGDGYGSASEPTTPQNPVPRFNDDNLRPDIAYYVIPRTYRGCNPPAKFVRNNSDLDDGNKYITTRRPLPPTPPTTVNNNIETCLLYTSPSPRD